MVFAELVVVASMITLCYVVVKFRPRDNDYPILENNNGSPYLLYCNDIDVMEEEV